ncbi:MAG TPA: phenylacetic acid degradation bifunctional protein PaaZ [Actinomycetes bacterium]|jgi:oxepin-CoA hydrolase / 3-oxo-5,6-dehydrosuberyl-CoA semialdehyde dehydrogenase|nr:phenylacetic acid degradation bifunctional protein PaaZ [Actinomycetes bacterium]
MPADADLGRTDVARMISSYVRDDWYTAGDEGATVVDASTGGPVARVSSAGVDLAGMVEHARTVGGPGLRELTFHQRAAALKRLAAFLRERRDGLYELSARSGATAGDAGVDVDGGIGALFVYASKGRRELPNDVLYIDGPPEPLGRGGTFVGQHVHTSRPGVAVLVNAFNFPVWGMLEKLAPAVLAGMPVIVKPASQTAYVAELAFRHMVESQALPPGSIQLLCGAVGDLFDHLTGQDTIAFTGSAATAHKLRCHPAVVRESVRFNAEADSLNCSILGPDAAPGTEEFQLFVTEVVRELTQKTGQKCTAIRRSLVPAEHVGAVVDALGDRLAEVRVGDPRDQATTMGPLVSRDQLAEVGRAVDRLGRGAEVALGGRGRPELASGDPERGAFCAPTVLVATSPRAPELHTVEAFGPVTSVIGYRGAADAVELAALGRGSLVGSVVTADPGFARQVVLGVAPWHGRLLVLDRHDAAESTGHGAPLPHLVHGGPGRAGGGEELGGIRAVLHHMQVTSISASPATVTAVTGRWTAGAPTTSGPVHPFRRHFEELAIGETLHTAARTVTLEDIERFADLSGDRFYAHMDEAAAKANPFFDGRVAHGYFVVSAAAGLFVDPDPGPCLANYGLERLRFTRPVYPGDTLRVALTCKQKSAREGEDYGEVRWDVVVSNQDGDKVATYDVLTLVACRPR